MNVEWLQIACMGLGGVLFAAGGTGFKWMRRFLLPVLLAGIALISGVPAWSCLGLAFGLIVVLCLPYGSGTPYWLKLLVFMAYPLPSLFIGFTWWQPICAIVCFGCFCLSNWKPTAETFFWKCVEFILGLMIGLTVAAQLGS